MKKIEKKHPLAIRWFHWINFPILCIMIWSGLLIYWANDEYRIGWGNLTLLKFFPEAFYDFFNLKFRLAEGMSLHFFFMWLFFVNGFLYVVYTFISGEWRLLLPGKNAFRDAFEVILYDLRISKIYPATKKYNAAQQIAYTAIILMGLGSLLTGLAIYKPIQLAWLTFLCGGYKFARLLHFALTIGYCIFFVIHVVQVILAGWNNFQSMITGVEVKRNFYSKQSGKWLDKFKK